MEQDTQILMNQVLRLYFQRSTDLFHCHEIHSGQGGLLMALSNNNGVSQKELAERLRVRPPSITAMIKKLVTMGYITKKQDEKDQRVVRIYITEQGEEIAAHMRKMMEQLATEAFAGMSGEEIMLLRRLLLQMRDNLSKNS